MNHLDLFSGIGGFSLAAQWVWSDDHNIISFVEIDKFCQKVLNKHWPDVPIHDDIRTYKHDGTNVDLLTGGWPCQPYSIAGKRRGNKDDRALWPEMLRVIKKAKPTWIVGENVANSLNMVIEEAASDLEKLGYEVRPFGLPACALKATHQRQRIFIVAHSHPQRLSVSGNIKKESYQADEAQIKNNSTVGFAKLANCEIFSNARNWPCESMFLRSNHGIPRRVDRIKSLGNAIVPQVVVPIMQAIKAIESN